MSFHSKYATFSFAYIWFGSLCLYMHNTHTVSHFGFRLLCRFSYPLCLRRFVKFNVFVSCDGSLNCLQNNNRKMEFACTTWSCFGSHNRKKVVLIQSLCLSLSFNQYHSLFAGHCVVFARAHTHSDIQSICIIRLGQFKYILLLHFPHIYLHW